jgi:hypothetical protein
MPMQFLYNIVSASLLLGLGFDFARTLVENRHLKAELERLREREAAFERVGRYLGRSLESEQKRHRELRERLGKAGIE